MILVKSDWHEVNWMVTVNKGSLFKMKNAFIAVVPRDISITSSFRHPWSHINDPILKNWSEPRKRQYMGVSENIGLKLPKIPPNHPFVHRDFHYFHHPFWGTTIYGNVHPSALLGPSKSCAFWHHHRRPWEMWWQWHSRESHAHELLPRSHGCDCLGDGKRHDCARYVCIYFEVCMLIFINMILLSNAGICEWKQPVKKKKNYLPCESINGYSSL